MKNKGKQVNLSSFLRNWAAVIALIISFVFFSVTCPTFLTKNNMETILRGASIYTVLALALTITYACGGFDLGAGSTASVSAYLVMSFVLWYDMNFWAASALTIVLTLLLQCISMFLILKCKVPDLLATLATQFMMQGLGLTYTGGGSVTAGMPTPSGAEATGKVPQLLKAIGRSPTIIYIMLFFVLLTHLFLNYTKYGRYIYTVGGNKTAAKLSGIPVKRYRFVAGMISAFFIALSAIMVCGRNQSAQINGCDGYTAYAMAAVYIGRTVAGVEKPNAAGTLIGAILTSVLDNGLVMIGVPYYSLPAVKGIVLAVALIAAYATSKEE